jgi:hypothetical protein
MKIQNSFSAPRSQPTRESVAPKASARREAPGQIDSGDFVLPSKDGKTTSAGSSSTSGVSMKYFGGGVLTKPDVKNVYLGHYFTTTTGKKDVAHNDAFMKDLVQNKDYTSIWAQYGVGKGTTEKSKTVDKTYSSGHVFKQADLEKMVKAMAKGAGSQEIFNFVLPPGAVLETSDGTTSKQGLGGFHGSVKVNGKEIYYSAIAYSKGDNGIDFTNGNAEDNISITESHEISEAATDPHVQDAIDTNNMKYLGWMDMNNGEIGDVEVNDASPGTPLSTMFGRMDGYAVQKIWSQVDKTNEIKAKHPGPVVPPKKNAVEIA